MGRLIDADKLNRKDVNCANVPMNFIDTAPTVEAIPKDQYEARLKADMVAMLTEIQLEIEEFDFFEGEEPVNITQELMDEVKSWEYGIKDCKKLIQQKIDLLQKQTIDNCDNCFNGTTKGGCAVKELMKNKDCKYYMPR